MSSIVRHRLVNLDTRQPGNETFFPPYIETSNSSPTFLSSGCGDVSISSLTRRKAKGERERERKGEKAERKRRKNGRRVKMCCSGGGHLLHLKDALKAVASVSVGIRRLRFFSLPLPFVSSPVRSSTYSLIEKKD